MVSSAPRAKRRTAGNRVRRPGRRDGIIALAALVLPGVIALGLLRRHAGVGTVSIWVTLAVGLPAIWLAWTTHRPAADCGEPALAGIADELALAAIADELALAVRAQWDAEAGARRLNDPYPIPVSWEAADPSLAGSWDALVRLASTGAGWPSPAAGTWAGGPEDLAAAGAQLADVLSRVPTGRLVVLGEPGAGKTTLMVRLVLDLLGRRQAGGPVPVLAGLSSWDPAGQDLVEWLASQMLLTYPALAWPAPGDPQRSRAVALIDAGRVWPVLDGLDEIPGTARRRAIQRISEALRPGWPVVLTCRTAEFRDALRPREGAELTFRSAAVIQLLPLDAASVRDYLCHSADGPAAATRWEPVLRLAGTPAPAGQALGTPLMLSLARAIYGTHPEDETGSVPDPAELASAELSDRDAVESRLFDGFLPAAYRDLRAGPAGRRGKRSADCAEAALVRLAQDLGGSAELRWWKPWTGDARAAENAMFIMPVAAAALTGLAGSAAFGDSIPRRLIAAVAAGIGVLLLMQFTLPTGAVAPRPGVSWGWERGWGQSLWTPIRVTLACAAALVPATWLEITAGPPGAAAWLAACLLAFGLQPKASAFTEAVTPRLSLARDRHATLAIVAGTGLVIGPGLGLACGTALGLLAGLTSGITAGLVAGLAIFPVASVFLFGVLQRHVDPQIDMPLEVAGLAMSLGASLLLAADTAVIFALGHPVATGVLVGSGYGATLGFGSAVIQSAWPRWLIIRTRLFTSRHAPWDLLKFLEEAHRREVLRQSGAAYQFRHLKLQQRLAARSRQDHAPGPRLRWHPGCLTGRCVPQSCARCLCACTICQRADKAPCRARLREFRNCRLSCQPVGRPGGRAQKTKSRAVPVRR
jgi:NACHT domain